MKVKYFQETDALYIEFRADRVTDTCDFGENTLPELDDQGSVCAMTVEHAGECIDIPGFSYEQISA